MWCAVKNCNNDNKSKSFAISFFNFPSDPSLLKQWISFCCRNKKINVKTSKICMEHFKTKDFENNLQFEMDFSKRRFLKPGVVPTIRKISSADEDRRNGRAQRIQRRENKKIFKMLIEEHDKNSVSLNASANPPSVQLMENEICMERLSYSESEVPSGNFSENSYEKNEMEFLKKEIERLEKGNSSLKDEGFFINGKPVRAEIVSKLLDITSGDLRISHKISEANLNVVNAKRQKVKLATKLFSHTVAQAITRAASQGHLEGLNLEECHRLFKMTNDWFDVMNVKVPYPDAREPVHAYGLSLSTQIQILDGMTEMVKEMRAIGRKTLLPFQKGIIQKRNNSIKGLYDDMVSRYGLKFILTYRLNQDVLEIFFGVIRSKGGLHDHPDQLEFKYRLRSYILVRNEGIISDGINVENDDTPDIEISEKSLTGKIIGVLNVSDNTGEPEPQELTDMEYDGLENLAGYICHKLKDHIPEIAVPENEKLPTYSWVDHLTEGGLSKPTQKTMRHMEALEYIFNTENGQNLVIRSNFIKSLLERAHHIECDKKVKTLFFRSRMYFKIRQLNEELRDSTTSRKRKYKKIMT